MKTWKTVLALIFSITVLSGCSAVSDVVAQTAADKASQVIDEQANNVVDGVVKAVVNKGGTNSQPSSDGQLEWAFTKAKQHPEQLLIGAIGEAKSTVDIAIYSLTHPDIVKAVLDAKKRGIAIRIISDEQQSGGKTQQQALKMLHNAGIPIKIDNHSGLMHLKMTIVDGKEATIGSYNYSAAASTTNDEVIMLVRNEAVAVSFTKEFEDMWKDNAKFNDYSLK